jgi:hypothetical protein
VARGFPAQDRNETLESGRHEKVIPNENVRT